MAREYFCAYHSFLKSMQRLTDEECGRLFRGLLEYSSGNSPQSIVGNEAYTFDSLRVFLDRDAEAYEEKCRKNRKNGAKRTPPNGSERYEEKANGSDRERTVANGGQYKDKYKDEDEDEYISPQTPQGACRHGAGTINHAAKAEKKPKREELSKRQQELFDRFWVVWPRKVSRGEAQKAWAKLSPDEALTEAITAGVERAKRLDHRFTDSQFTPHAATWLRAKGWEDEYDAGGETVEYHDPPGVKEGMPF